MVEDQKEQSANNLEQLLDSERKRSEDSSGHVPTFTLVKLPGLNHLFQTARTGLVTEYAQSEETISPRALAVIVDWLRGNVQ